MNAQTDNVSSSSLHFDDERAELDKRNHTVVYPETVTSDWFAEHFDGAQS